jgi:hypothetical protein
MKRRRQGCRRKTTLSSVNIAVTSMIKLKNRLLINRFARFGEFHQSSELRVHNEV